MNSEHRDPAALESYATFWDQVPRATALPPIPGEDAYTTFVNLSEDEFPSGEWQLLEQLPPDSLGTT